VIHVFRNHARQLHLPAVQQVRHCAAGTACGRVSLTGRSRDRPVAPGAKHRISLRGFVSMKLSEVSAISLWFDNRPCGSLSVTDIRGQGTAGRPHAAFAYARNHRAADLRSVPTLRRDFAPITLVDRSRW
jgi:hypothetical protein